MADYSIIADVSTWLMKLLRETMCPEPITSPSQIELASPADENVDYTLGVYLYDMQEEKNVVLPRFQPAGRMAVRQSPMPYRLYYMIYVNGSSQRGLRAFDIQRIMGRAAQIVNDQRTVLPGNLQPWLEVPEPPIELSQAKISLEEKVRIWQAVNKPYQMSLFYEAAPILLSSDNIQTFTRVREAQFTVQVSGNGEGG